jgi:hypothetical protein
MLTTMLPAFLPPIAQAICTAFRTLKTPRHPRATATPTQTPGTVA